MEVLDKVKDTLSKLTEGYDNAEKIKYIQSMGFNSFDDIAALKSYEMLSLLKDLKAMLVPEVKEVPIIQKDLYVDTVNGYRVRRGECARTTGFLFPRSHKVRD